MPQTAPLLPFSSMVHSYLLIRSVVSLLFLFCVVDPPSRTFSSPCKAPFGGLLAVSPFGSRVSEML